MDKTVKLRLGTRQSPLAVVQAQETRDRLCHAHGWTSDCVELVRVRASGDRIQDRPLAEIGGKALWTRELDVWLREGKIDGAVHSMKDVETIRPPQIALGALLPRADIRDALIGAEDIAAIPRGARVGTCAPRRAAQLRNLRPDCTIVPFRGNVATRLEKLAAGAADVTFLAAAGLARLGRDDVGSPLDPKEWIPAAGQGAIAVEYRAGDARIGEILSAIDDQPTRIGVEAERALLNALGGTCHSPVAAQSMLDGDMLVIRAAVFSADGAQRIEGQARCVHGEIAPVENLARDLLDRGGPHIAQLFNPPR